MKRGIFMADIFSKEQRKKKTAWLKQLLAICLGLPPPPQAGMAIVSGTQQVVGRQILKHSRNNEDAADNSGLNFLDKAGYSAKGMLEVLEVLYSKEVSLYAEINPYTLTHPLSRERIEHVRAHYEKSPLSCSSGLLPSVLLRPER